MLDEFISLYKGKFLDIDGVFGGQCVDLAKAWAKANDLPVVQGNGKDWAKAPGYEWVEYRKGLTPSAGDIVVWSSPKATGHVGIAVKAGLNTFTSFDQNWPVGAPCSLVDHNYVNVLGWLKVKEKEVTQEQKDKEKLFGLWQAGTGKYPDQQGVDIQKELDHVASIKVAKVKDGMQAGQADCEQWRQYILERIQDGTFKF